MGYLVRGAPHLTVYHVWTNTLPNLEKYILPFRQIHFIIWRNVFLPYVQILSYVGQIYFAMWTNSLYDLENMFIVGSVLFYCLVSETNG